MGKRGVRSNHRGARTRRDKKRLKREIALQTSPPPDKPQGSVQKEGCSLKPAEPKKKPAKRSRRSPQGVGRKRVEKKKTKRSLESKTQRETKELKLGRTAVAKHRLRRGIKEGGLS